MNPEAAVARARALVGTRFRPQGRCPSAGLDCVGLVLQVFGITPNAVRRDYRLRGNSEAELCSQIERFFHFVAAGRAGDVALCRSGQQQLHLCVLCGGSFVHADARLRRVVETPGKPGWPTLGSYRVRTEGK